MLLKIIGQPLGTAESRQEMPKGYWIASGQFLEGTYWKAAGKCPNFRRQPIGDKTELPSGYWLKPGISIPFL
jgi:hypothetical protein